MQYAFFRHWTGEYLYFDSREELVAQCAPQLWAYYLHDRCARLIDNNEMALLACYRLLCNDGSIKEYPTYDGLALDCPAIFEDMVAVQLHYANAMCFEYINDNGVETFAPCEDETTPEFVAQWFAGLDMSEAYINSVARTLRVTPKVTQITPVEVLP